MDPVTHVATGVLISQLLPAPSRFWAALAGAAFALMPDADYFLVWIDRLAFVRHHRGFSHSLIALPLLALCGAGVNAAIGGKDWLRPFFILGAAVLASHLLLDWATSYGTQLLSPFSQQKFSLDWLFIIDPYLTAILLAGALAALCSPGWGRGVGAVCLAGAAAYLLLCGCYHHQALSLARQVFAGEVQAGAAVAALPQPLSPRRWQLIAARPREISQTMVQLPYRLWLPLKGAIEQVQEVAALTPYPGPLAAAYRPPESLLVQERRGVAAPLPSLSPEARRILDLYLDFARFPLLARVEPQGDGFLLAWMDLRFTVPGRDFPFVLRLRQDARARLQEALLGQVEAGKIHKEP